MITFLKFIDVVIRQCKIISSEVSRGVNHVKANIIIEFLKIKLAASLKLHIDHKLFIPNVFWLLILG